MCSIINAGLQYFILLVVMPFRSEKYLQRFGSTCCLFLQGRKHQKKRTFKCFIIINIYIEKVSIMTKTQLNALFKSTPKMSCSPRGKFAPDSERVFAF
jgi:hypothetical protein